MISLREEAQADIDGVWAVNTQAFPTNSEADLVTALRASADCISLVAHENGVIVGHILFSPVVLRSGGKKLCLFGLAPMAVSPARQRSGIGSQMVISGLAECQRRGADAVVVLGHPNFYPRFGFRSSLEFGLDSDYDVPADVFMAKELVAGSLSAASGRVHYHSAFSDL